MKNVLFFTISLMSAINLFAQNVGIGTNTPDASAKLDVVDANRGVLIPRVALTSTLVAAPVATPANSLLVFNTNTAGDVTPGYYYWDSGLNRWVRLLTTQSNDWMLDGNNNGILRTIGTNDNFDFPIETNGTEKMRVTTAGNVGIATTVPGARLDVVGPATGTGITIRAAGGGDVVLNSGGSLFFDGNYSYATGNYIRPIAANTQTFVTSGAERMRITPVGNVGIGTAAPTQRLHVSGGSILTDRSYAASTLDLAAAAAINIAQPATQVRITNVAGAQANAVTYSATAIEGQYLWISNTDDDAATFAGATIPSNTAMGFVYTGGAWRPVRAMDSQGDWKLDGNTNAALRYIGTNDNFDFPIRTNGTEKMRVTTAGNVGIGTATPPSRLTIGNNLATGALDNFSEYQILLWESANALQSYGLGIRPGTVVFNSNASYQFDEVGVTRVTFAGGGNVGIGNTAPGYALTVTRTAPNTEAFLHLEGTGDVNAAGINIRDVDTDRMWHIVNRAGDNNKLIFYRWNGAAWQHLMQMDMNTDNIAINNSGAGPDASAILDVSSTTKGVLLPRMTTAQRDAIPVSTARQGLLIYNTDNNCFEFFDTKANPTGSGGFWNSLCDYCDQVVVISTNQTGFNLNSYIGGSKAMTYCVYIQTGVTLQAAGNGGGPGAAGNPGFNATTMANGSKVILYNRGNILAGGGNGGRGGRESDGICEGDNDGGNGGAGGHAIVTNSIVPITVYNYGTIRAGGGGGGGGRGGCCSSGGGGGGGAGTPAGAGGWGNSWSCVGGFVCTCGNRSGSSPGGNPGTALVGGTGGGVSCSGGTACPGTGSGCGSPGGNGGNPGIAGSNGSTANGCCGSGCTAGSGGAAGLALQGSGSGSSLINVSGTVTGGVNP